MKYSFYIILFLFIQNGILLSQETTPNKIDWNKLSITWRNFLDDPTELNGMKVCDLLPNEHYYIKEPDSVYYAAWDSLYENLNKLEDLIKNQRRIAVVVAFKLFTISDSDFTETLDQMLGRLINKNSQMFLEELDSHRKLIGPLDGLLRNLGDKYVDNTEAKNREFKLRIQALESVKKESLLSIRNECIAELSSKIK